MSFPEDGVYTHTDNNLKLHKYPDLIVDIDNVKIEDVKIDELYENKTESEVIEEAHIAIQKIEKTIPKIKIVSLPPDKEIAYKQRFIPQCKLCKSKLRDEIEAVYVKYNFVPHRVVQWCKSQGFKVTWECVATHMKNHCIWDKPLVNVVERIKAREDELAPIKNDRIQWNLDALTSANLDLLSQLDSLDGDSGIKTYKAVCEGIKVQAQLMKLQHDTVGAQAQAQSMIEANNKRLVNFLEKLMEVLDDDKKMEVIEFMREFQNEEHRI